VCSSDLLKELRPAQVEAAAHPPDQGLDLVLGDAAARAELQANFTLQPLSSGDQPARRGGAVRTEGSADLADVPASHQMHAQRVALARRQLEQRASERRVQQRVQLLPGQLDLRTGRHGDELFAELGLTARALAVLPNGVER